MYYTSVTPFLFPSHHSYFLLTTPTPFSPLLLPSHHSYSLLITPTPFSPLLLFSSLLGGSNNQPAVALTEPLQILRANIRNNRLEYDGRVSITVKVKNFVPGLRGAMVRLLGYAHFLSSLHTFNNFYVMFDQYVAIMYFAITLVFLFFTRYNDQLSKLPLLYLSFLLPL